MSMITAIGLMSGTSMDGVDAAIIRTDGVTVELTEYFHHTAYDKSFRQKLQKAVLDKNISIDVKVQLTEIHANAVISLLANSNMNASDIDIIGFHGHTIEHRPEDRFTFQAGDGQLLADLTAINVICDFRSADIKYGGQGAPLVPVYHQALFVQSSKAVAVINIGGVTNVTFIDGTFASTASDAFSSPCQPAVSTESPPPPEVSMKSPPPPAVSTESFPPPAVSMESPPPPAGGVGGGYLQRAELQMEESKKESCQPSTVNCKLSSNTPPPTSPASEGGEEKHNLIAFDIGAGNALIDDIVQANTGKSYDQDGAIAYLGTVHQETLHTMLNDSYFSATIPKSLDRNYFHKYHDLYSALPFADAVATLTMFTVQAIKNAEKYYPQAPKSYYICGGGVHNATMMEWLNDSLTGNVYNISEYNINPDAVEAQAFAYLAARVKYGLPITFTSTTNIAEENITHATKECGKFYHPTKNLRGHI